MSHAQDTTTFIAGRYFTANASHFFSASLSRDDSGLVVHVEHFIEPFRPERFERSQPLAGLPTKLTFPDGSVFEALSEDDLLSVLGMNGGFFEWLKRHEKRLTSILASLVITIAAIIGFSRWGLSALALVAAWATPPILAQTMDFGSLKTLDHSILSASKLSSDQKAAITTDFETLVNASGLPKDRLKIVFRDAPAIGPNAFSFPGGTILVTDQLADLSQNPDEIAGVLAHELGHFRHHHSLSLIYQALGIGFFISMISGDPGSGIDTLVQQASALQTLAYTRDFERKADQESVALMQKLGRDPFAMITLLDRIIPQEHQNDVSFLSTHPGLEERRQEVTHWAHSLAPAK